MVLNIAHRGFSAAYPENTLLAFEKALELGVTWLELDLQVTRDGHLVVMHDRTVDRTTDGSGAVRDLTLDEIKALDAGIWRGREFEGERVPTFEEVLDALVERAMIVVELKFEGLEPIAPVLDRIRTRNAGERIVVSSFDLPKLPRVRELEPAMSTTALLRPESGTAGQMVATTLDLGADTIAPRCGTIDADLVDAAHEAGLAVRAWGLGRDQGEEMTRLLDAGVDGMTTDCPDILQRLLSGRA